MKASTAAKALCLAFVLSGCAEAPKELAGRALQVLRGMGDAYDRKVAAWYDHEAAAARIEILSARADCTSTPEASATCWEAYDARMRRPNAVVEGWRVGPLRAIQAAQAAALAALQATPDSAGEAPPLLRKAESALRAALQQALEYLVREGVPVEDP